MKILYDLTSLVSPRTGIGHYTQHLIEGMLQQPQTDLQDVVGVQYVTVYSRSELSELIQQPAYTIPNSFVKLKKSLWPLLRALPGAYRFRVWVKEKLAQSKLKHFAKQNFIYHETNFIPQTYSGKLVISAHDISHIRYPEHHPKERVNFLNQRLPIALKRADKVIAGSEFTRQELLACFPLDPEKVVTVLDGVGKEFKPREETEITPTLNKYHLQYQKYTLSVCTLEPRKNLVRLLKAFALLPQDLRQTYPLVLVGGKGWQGQEILTLAAPLLHAKELILTGYVAEADLLQLYSGAKMFAYPSLYEGFGLPVLEAMASGIPVLTSNTSSLPEISAGAAIEVDPLSIEEITAGLKRLLDDTALANVCIEKGLVRAKLLTWDRCVQDTIEVYRSL